MFPLPSLQFLSQPPLLWLLPITLRLLFPRSPIITESNKVFYAILSSRDGSSFDCFPLSFEVLFLPPSLLGALYTRAICKGICGVPLAQSWAAVCPLRTFFLEISFTAVASTASSLLTTSKSIQNPAHFFEHRSPSQAVTCS